MSDNILSAEELQFLQSGDSMPAGLCVCLSVIAQAGLSLPASEDDLELPVLLPPQGGLRRHKDCRHVPPYIVSSVLGWKPGFHPASTLSTELRLYLWGRHVLS